MHLLESHMPQHQEVRAVAHQETANLLVQEQ
jgi:hypothetical protein